MVSGRNLAVPPPAVTVTVSGEMSIIILIECGRLTYLVDYLFKDGPPPPCEDAPGYYPEADIDASGAVNVADLTYLVDYLFKGGPQPAPCP